VLRAGTTLDFGITDANLNTTTWTNGSGPNPLSSPFDIATTGWADGAYTVVVSSTDLAGNPGSGTIQLIIDSTFPVWTFVAPGNASTVVAGAVLQFDLAEMHPTAANWSNGGAPVAFTPQWDNATGVVSGTTYSVNTAGWVDAVYTLTLSARDASGNVVVAIYSLSIDSTGPTITLASPPNDSVVTPGTVLIFDIVESSLASATWSTGGAPSNFTTPFNLSTAGWADGSYNVTVRAADRAGNAAVEVFHMIVDGTPPVIRTPLWNNSYGDAGTSLLISIQEDNPQSLTANLGRGPVSSTGLFVVVGTTGLPEGAYNVSVTAVDQAGHTANATFRFIVDSTGPVIHSVTPANGSFVRPGVLITFSVTESNLLNVTWRRNGGALLPANGSGPFTIDTSLWADFNNTVLLIARDRVDHLAIFVLILVTDSQPPTLPAFLANYSYDEDLTVPFDASASSDGANPLNASSVVWNFSARLSALMVGFFVNYTWDTPGNYTVVLTVTDAAGNVNSILLGVRVLDTTPPTANAGPDTTADEDGPFMLDGSASGDNDPDAAANLRYSWTQTAGPAVSLDATSPTPSITPTTPGMYAFELTVTDGAGLSDTDSVQIAVRDITPPALPALVFPVYNEGATVLFNASGTTDNDVANQSQVVFVWTFVDGSLFEIDAITGSHVFATPGLYTINLTAYDVSGNRASVLLPLRINDIPGLATMPPTDFELPGIYEVTLDITDDDAGDTHNVTVQSPPTMTVVTLGGKPALRFDPGSFGMYWVNFTISDGWSSVNFSVLLTVTSPVTGNRPPAFTTEPVLEATSSRQYSYLAQATDPDGDRLVYGLDVFPAGMTVNEVTGAINWPHGYTASSGNHFDNVSFWVWDGAHFVYQNFTIRFLAAGNAPPVIADGFLTAVSVKNGTAYTYPNPAEFVTDGNDGLASLIFNITVADPSIATATLQGTGGATEIRYVGLRVGTTTATLRVRDPSGAVATKSIQVTVEPVGASAPNTDAFSGFLLPLLLAAGAAGGAAFFIVMRRKKGQNAEVLTPSAPAQAVHVAPEVVAVAPPVVRARPSAVSLGREAAAAAAAASPATVPAVAPGEKKITYTIEGLFVIYKDGRLLYSKTDMGQAKFEDPELVSSMFTAVQSFIKDSFQAEGELNKMGYGDNQVIIERGNHIFVAAIVYGEPDLEFMDGVRAAIEGIELSYAGIIEGWDGMMDHFSDMDQKLAPVAALTAGITRREVQLATTKQEVLMLSELEFFQGFVRLKVGIKNNTASVITKATVDIEYNEDVLRLARVEPAAYRTSGAKVLLGVLNPAEKSSVAYYFDPQICTESQIDGVCRYRDATGVLHTVSMKTRKAEVVCPLFFTKEHANTAMLKRLVESELNEKDAKVFEIQKMPPYIKYKDVFDLIKSVVNAHDVQQVREFTKYNPFQGEAWFYGETKVKGYKIVIRASVIEEGTSIEFFAASTNMKAITGLLAEFNHTLNSMVIEKYSDLKIALTFDAEKKAEIEKKSLMSAMGSAELEGGETEQPGGGEGAPPPDPGA
jgi:hypothetical protein